jgi:ATP-dependent Lon protease
MKRMAKLLPLFPLQLVVFPRTQLPLHIFEDRYKEMVGEAIANQTEFGIVLAKEDGIVNAGCTVVVEQVVTRYEDGRMDVMTRGSRRFEIVLLNEEKTYLRGEVEFFDDDEPGPAPEPLQQEALLRYRGLLELGEMRGYSDPVLTDPQLSFQLAQAVQDLDFQSVILRNRSEPDRLKQFSQFLAHYVPRMKQATKMKKLAPLNGFGHKPTGI